MAAPARPVFLSYASEDTEAAEGICNSLRAAGIEVWFDKSELRGGDAWDHHIRRQIADCALFVPIISAHTQARSEGYFRLEWDLADQRSHMIVRSKAFIIPVCVDDTPDHGAEVPESFLTVQWTRLPDGAIPTGFVERISRLLSPEAAHPPAAAVRSPAAAAAHTAAASRSPAPRSLASRQTQRVPLVIAVLAVIGVGYFAVDKLILSKRPALDAQSPVSAGHAGAPAPSAIPEKSIAVLAFVDMSEKHDQEYFGDGMAEELIDRLAQLPELRVISRTSAFQFKAKSEDVRLIGAKLSVANILEGSVRRSGDHLRVVVQLVNASDGSHRWSQSYDRRANDVFKVQDEIANDVVQALKVKLVGTLSQERAPTENIAAHDLLLEGRFFQERWATGDSERAISSYERAIKEDPSYALAWAELSWAALWQNSWERASSGDYERATRAALKAIELRPDLAQAHATRGWCESLLGFDWALADAEFSKALALEPQNMRALYGKGRLARVLGKNDESLRFYHAALERDPVNAFVMQGLTTTLIAAGRAAEAVQNARRALEINPSMRWGHWYLGYALFWNGELEAALSEMRLEPGDSLRLSGVALIEQSRHDPRAADAALRELLASNVSARNPYLIAAVYAARGDARVAVEWLERARAMRIGWFGEVSADPAFNPIRGDPGFVALLRRSKLPG